MLLANEFIRYDSLHTRSVLRTPRVLRTAAALENDCCTMRSQILICTALIVLAEWERGDCTCFGSSCDKQHNAARSAGLLGGTAAEDLTKIRPKACRGSKPYPKDGALEPLVTEAPVVDVVWAGKDNEEDKFVFALLRGYQGDAGGRLYRSDHYGKHGSWDDRTNEMTDALDEKDRKDALVGVISIHSPKRRPGHMLFQGPGHMHWTSKDFGETYEAQPTPGKTLGYGASIKIHPTQPDWVLSLVRRNECIKEATAISRWCAKDLFFSEDFGATWRNLTEGSSGRVASVWDYEWAAVLHGKEKDAAPDPTIFATVYGSTKAMKGPYPGWDKDMQFIVSKDYFKSSHTRLVPCGNQFEIVHDQVYLAVPADCPVHPDGSKRSHATGKRSAGRTVQLLISNDEALTFQDACLPLKWLDLSYNLMKTHDGNGAFVIVDADELDDISARAPMSNIYSSGPKATIYTIGMRRNFQRGHINDFARVEGLPGMYLANQLDGKIFNDPSLMPSRSAYGEFVQTKLTLNGAASWQELSPPEKFTWPQCSTCHPGANCNLHLHGPSSWHYGADARPSFYSHKSAPGVVMAVGNTGEYLDAAAESTCTWVSSDGGQSWTDILPSAAIYEVGDRGGVIMTTLHQNTGPTDEVYFSLESGACWYTVQLSEAINVQNIRVEPKGASDTFIVHGQACLKSAAHPTCTHHPGSRVQPGGRSYTIDISDVMGDDLVSCRATDYEEWSPPQPSQCLLGRNYTMHRRKTSSNCFNKDSPKKTHSEACPCTVDDTECEFGHEYDPTKHECSKIPDVDIGSCQLVKDGKYVESSTHRRLIHEDTCTNIEAIIFDSNGKGVPTGGLPGRRRSGWKTFLWLLLLAGFVFVGFGIWWSKFAPEAIKDSIEEAISPAFEFCVGIVGGIIMWVRAKISGEPTAQSEAQEAFFAPLSGGDDALDDFGAEDRRSAPVFGYT